MKKLITLTLCLVMVLSLAACKPSNSQTPSQNDSGSSWGNKSALEILQTIAQDADTQIMAEITDGTELYQNALTLGELEFKEIALYMPMISSQRFEVAVIRVKDGTKVADYVSDLESRASKAQWVCAAPPDFVKVVAVGDCVLYMAVNSEFVNEQAMIEAFQSPKT